ncbi:Integrase family protein [Carbonactinospora thermoautotrophica]|uniref:Integrase family protein n=1 Tax=Carbonactinospora thermoautotrophica TaxID=1469144 RepID=A0A132MYH1_9ACTN|nr:site-specific integrase [Carbonactinospora thermoautotrophica]KWX02766.1 Integrase family protein [Carbonactinospora thermoautotrophica]
MSNIKSIAGRPNEGGRPVSYDVRIYKILTYEGKRRTTYTVRWKVAGRPFRKPHTTRALADSFRAKLISYANDGVPFDVETGLPLPLLRQQQKKQVPTWYQHAIDYVDRQWDRASSKQRASIADTLATVTLVLVRTDKGMPDKKILRRALSTWAFNKNTRTAGEPPEELAPALRWIACNSLRVDELADTEVMERALQALASKLDGTPAAANTYRRKRPIFGAALRYAVKRKYLAANPLENDDIEFDAPKAVEAVDPRTVPNPKQATALIEAAGEVQPSGPSLKAFFGCIYFSGMRPGEAARLREDQLELPAEDQGTKWGRAYLEKSAPRVGRSWTNNGKTREEGPLKHRPEGTVRVVPIPPQLVRLLRAHLKEHGTTPDGRLFRGYYGGELSESTYGRVWEKARREVLTPAQVASTLAKRPYDLRHACVSTWLKAGIDPARIAEWAGHSVDVLLRIYVHCLDGGETEAQKRIEDALKGS